MTKFEIKYKKMQRKLERLKAHCEHLDATREAAYAIAIKYRIKNRELKQQIERLEKTKTTEI